MCVSRRMLLLHLTSDMLCGLMLKDTDIKAVHNLALTCKTMANTLKPLREQIKQRKRLLLAVQSQAYTYALFQRPLLSTSLHYYHHERTRLHNAMAVYYLAQPANCFRDNALFGITAMIPREAASDMFSLHVEHGELFRLYTDDENGQYQQTKNVIIQPISESHGTFLAYHRCLGISCDTNGWLFNSSDCHYYDDHNEIAQWLPYSNGALALLHSLGYR